MNVIKITILLFCLASSFTLSGQSFTAIHSIDPLTISTNTGEKPQSKVWNHDNKWWAVMPDSAGTYIRRLDHINGQYTWERSLKISNSTETYADCKVDSSLLHVLLFDKGTLANKARLISLEYDTTMSSYSIWNSNSPEVILNNTVETATIDIDSQNRIWITYEQNNDIKVRWSDVPYTIWSNEIILYSGVKADDICAIVHLNDKIGVLWSNQNTKRFGFRFHEDTQLPSNWSIDEVPAGSSALNIGYGMADDHLNMAVLGDGTLFCAVKTGYDANGQPTIGLIVRDPNGSWSQLYNVSESGTRPIVTINEATQKLQVVYTNSELGGDIVYKESDINQIAFGGTQMLISQQGSLKYNNVSGAKNNYTSEIVFLASSGNQMASVVASSSPPQPLVAHYQMDENGGTALIDESNNNNAGTIIGNQSWCTDQNGGHVLNLDGTSYATISDSPSLDVTNAVTIAGWIKPSLSAYSTQYVIKKGNYGTTDGYELSLSNSGKVFVRFNQQTSGNNFRINSVSSYPLNDSGWMHIAATYDLNSQLVKLYIDGVEEGSVPMSTPIITNDQPLTIGAQSNGASKFNGLIEDVRVYDAALTSSEISVLAANPPQEDCNPTSTAPLVAYYQMDENGGTALFDESNNNNAGTIVGTQSWCNDQNDGHVLNLDGTTHVTIPDSPSLDVTDAITIAGWIKPSLLAYSTQYVIKKGNYGTTDGYELSLSNSGKVFVRFNQKTSGNNFRINSVSSYPLNNSGWMHVAATYDLNSELVKLYIDGVEEGSVSMSTPIITNDEPLAIGAQSNGVSKFSGFMDDVRIYDAALTSSEISVLAANPPQEDCNPSSMAPLVAHYEMDENGGAALTDDSNNNNAGTIIGNQSWCADQNGGHVLNLDGSTHATIPDSPSLDVMNAITIAGWIKPSLSSYSTQYVIKKGNYGTTDGYELSLSNSGKVFVRFNQKTSGNNFRINSVSSYPLNDSGWMHVAATYDLNSQLVKLYIDGVEEGSVAMITPIIANDQPLAIGAQSNGASNFSGFMDDVRIYDAALTSSEISVLAANPPQEDCNPTSTAPLAAHYEMDENGGTALTDDSNNNNAGTIIGNQSWCIDQNGGHVLNLDGSTHATIPDSPSLDLTNVITIAGWIKPSLSSYSTQYVIKKGNIFTTDGYELSLSVSGKVFVRFNQKTSGNNFRINSVSSYPLNDSGWMHIAATYDLNSQLVKLYIDGVEEGSVPMSTPIITNDQPLAIGAQSNGASKFSGFMDDVRIYDTALTSSEISVLAANPPQDNCTSNPPPQAHNKIDESREIIMTGDSNEEILIAYKKDNTIVARFSSDVEHNATWLLSNMVGQTLLKKNVEITAGDNFESFLNIHDHHERLVIITIITPTKIISKKVLTN